MIEAAEQSFESRPSIQSLSQLIFNAWPRMIPFNMSMYAMLEVSLFEFVPLYQRGILNCQREHNFITTFSLFCSQIYTRRITDRVAIRHISFLFCFVFFRGKPIKIFEISSKKACCIEPPASYSPPVVTSLGCH